MQLHIAWLLFVMGCTVSARPQDRASHENPADLERRGLSGLNCFKAPQTMDCMSGPRTLDDQEVIRTPYEFDGPELSGKYEFVYSRPRMRIHEDIAPSHILDLCRSLREKYTKLRASQKNPRDAVISTPRFREEAEIPGRSSKLVWQLGVPEGQMHLSFAEIIAAIADLEIVARNAGQTAMSPRIIRILRQEYGPLRGQVRLEIRATGGLSRRPSL